MICNGRKLQDYWNSFHGRKLEHWNNFVTTVNFNITYSYDFLIAAYYNTIKLRQSRTIFRNSNDFVSAASYNTIEIVFTAASKNNNEKVLTRPQIVNLKQYSNGVSRAANCVELWY